MLLKPRHTFPHAFAGSREAGITLLETAIAAALLLAVSAALLPLATRTLTTTEGQDQMGRATGYAQDKMEELMALSFDDAASDTRVFPASQTGGTGLAVGGSTDPDDPVAGYLDFLDVNGSPLAFSGTTAPDGWFYKRLWRVELISTTRKRITVAAMAASAAGGRGPVPQCTLVCVKVSPF